jgi:hypothetical protein
MSDSRGPREIFRTVNDNSKTAQRIVLAQNSELQFAKSNEQDAMGDWTSWEVIQASSGEATVLLMRFLRAQLGPRPAQPALVWSGSLWAGNKSRICSIENELFFETEEEVQDIPQWKTAEDPFPILVEAVLCFQEQADSAE